MQIFIPSHRRVGNIAEGRSTLSAIPPEWKDRTKVVVYPDELDLYQRTLNRMGIQAIACDCPRGIQHKRHWIGQNAGPTFLMMDDDFKFFERKSPDAVDLVRIYNLAAPLAALETALGIYAMVGMIDRVNSSRAPLGVPPPNIQENIRINGVMGFQREVWAGLEHGRVELMEDFDLGLQILRAGHTTANVSHWSYDQQQTQAKGGCSGYRSHEMQDRAARRLAELHPGLVSLRLKENKTGGAFGTRTEVTIQWKKAAKEGMVKKELLSAS